MKLLKKLDKQAGLTLRWGADLITGNYFKRIEVKLGSVEQQLSQINKALMYREDSEIKSLVLAMFDEQQERILREFNAKMEKPN
ncbi:hypothetical protein P6U16_22600 (plasmid) [Rhizobium sp. 32-5/1]|uniref:hypothetical protein n=1 Tax=Rhizobium sp. 32-5/1 TaxID=3019602 RepID=UPI00240D8748|nr:hypothetical protein [Rhizobium sp. 32-5/1]WEZ85810.1 hypothetical protein P6U16_22600 [Rhizobium sp. 32-5/1]